MRSTLIGRIKTRYAQPVWHSRQGQRGARGGIQPLASSAKRTTVDSASIIKKYTFVVQWDERNDRYIGRCLEYRTLRAYAPTQDEAFAAIRDKVGEHLTGKTEVQEPISLTHFRGTITIRVPPDLHRDLVVYAATQGISLNQVLLSIVAQRIREHGMLPIEPKE